MKLNNVANIELVCRGAETESCILILYSKCQKVRRIYNWEEIFQQGGLTSLANVVMQETIKMNNMPLN